jgi:glycosyltransferase involved in cell wall biosynthesis
MLYDYSLSFHDNEKMPLAGTQTAFIELAKAFVSIGCKVTALTSSKEIYKRDNLYWGNLDDQQENIKYDLLIVNVSPWLFEKFKHVKSQKKILWVHNEAKYLLYWKRYKYILRFWPTIVFSGRYHKSTFPWFVPSGPKKIIPLGISDVLFKTIENNNHLNKVKGKRVYFTSNPLRSLKWIVDLWVNNIHPKVPEAELHIFSSWKTYGTWGSKVKDKMEDVLSYISNFSDKNIYLRDPLPKEELFKEMRTGRAMFYKGDTAETFCLAVAEAQALGLPAVVCDVGSMNERVKDNETGYVAKNKNNFINCCIDILVNDHVFSNMSICALESYKEYKWDKIAIKYISL